MQGPPTVFSQIIQEVHNFEVQRIAERYPTRRKTPRLSPYDHFCAMVFGQLTRRESMRDLSVALCARKENLYHLGIRGNPSSGNLGYANEHRDWRFARDIVELLTRRVLLAYKDEPMAVDFEGKMFAVDATVIRLCLKLYPWAKQLGGQGSIKLNVMLDLQGNIPCFTSIYADGEHEVRFIDEMPITTGDLFVMDRGYYDFERLFKINEARAFFVIRAKKKMRFWVSHSRKVDRRKGLLADQTIFLSNSRRLYPEALRRVVYFDFETQKRFIFLTNHFELPAETIALIYKQRWQIELFFRWIKAHLLIKSLLSRSENGVRFQIYCVIATFLLVALAKKRFNLSQSLYELLSIFSLYACEKITVSQLFTENQLATVSNTSPNQLSLNGFC
jgi:hypothetical protein